VLGDIPSLHEVWGETATYVSPDDGDALLAAIERLIAEPDHRARMAWHAHRRALTYGPDDMARRYLTIYQNVTSGRDLVAWSLLCAS
jgi:glycosyltransferase involved in cell wall biosynthesis